jgi:hypothetical protein
MNTETCKCNCGYTCGGPGKCELSTLECIEQHFVRDCEHDFTGPLIECGEGCWSVTCKKCGMSAMHHDCVCGP